MSDTNTLYLKQLLSGRDHAITHPVAGQMVTFAYLVGCKEAGECLVVDPSWVPSGIVQIAEEAGLKVVGSIATHCHPDHVGGGLMGFDVPGLKEMCELIEGPVHVHAKEADILSSLTGVPKERLVVREEGDVIEVGQVRISVLHTPGHSPGSISLLAGDNVMTGDVLFVGACGRLDLPGADPREMFHSLRKLAKLPPKTVVLPGHDYGTAPQSTIEEEARSNPYMQADSEDEWLRMMGGPAF